MWDVHRTWHCSVCDTELIGKNEPCPLCSAWKSIRDLQAIVRQMLPYVRLYSAPEDSPDYDSEVRKISRLTRRAERLLPPAKKKRAATPGQEPKA